MRLRNILISIAFALSVPFAAHAAAPLEAYTKLPALEQPQISPAGDRLAYIAVVNDSRRLGVQTLTGQSLGTVPLGDQKVRSIRWVDEDHVLVGVEKFIKIEDERQNLTTMLLYNVKTKKFAALLDQQVTYIAHMGTSLDPGSTAGPFVISAPEIRVVDGKTVMYVEGLNAAYHPTNFRIDLETGHGLAAPEAEGYLDDAGKPILNADYDKDSGHWEAQYREGQAWKKMWSGEGYRIERPSVLGVGRAPGTALISVPEASGDVIYEVTHDGKATKMKVGEGGEPADVHPVYRANTSQLIGFEWLSGNDRQVVFLDPAKQAVWEGVEAGFKDEDVVLASYTPDFSKFVIRTSSATNPGAFYLIDNVAHHAVKIGSDYPGLTPADVAEVRYIHYKAADGTVIPAYLTLPRGRDPKNLPLIVLPHGGPQARDEPGSFDFFSQTVASRGYAVLQPEFRGSTGFGKAHFEGGFGQWGRKMQTDLSDGVRYLAAQGIADPKRVCIFGWSYGGYAALAGPTLDPGVYRCAVAGAPVSDIPAMLGWEKEQTGGRHDSVAMRYEKRYMGVSDLSDAKLVEISPTRHVDKVTVPILLIHGKEDTTVPYNQSELMVEALKRAGKPVEFVTLSAEDHHLSKGKTRQEAMNAVVTFLEKNNPPN